MTVNTQLAIYLALRGLEFSFRILPYDHRIRMGGWVMRKMIAPLTDMAERVDANLRHVYPEMHRDTRRQTGRKIIDNFGRFYFEFFSSKEFIRRADRFSLKGSGLEEINQARAQKRVIILVSGHIGNYEAVRSYMKTNDCELAGVYKPMSNRFFNDIYTKRMREYGQPVFATNREGTKDLIDFIKGGNIVSLIVDQHAQDGIRLPFLGLPARTSLGFAKLALKYKALVIPAFGIRQANGLDFDVVLERSIALTDEITMAQEFNSRLESHVERHVDQWFWIHRRWK